MNTKEYMKTAKKLMRRIKRKRDEADELRIKERCPSSASFSDMPKTASPNPHQKYDGVLTAIELDKEADAALDELNELKKQFYAFLLQLTDPDERDLLYKRYIEFKKWEQIAVEIGYSESHTKRLHGIAVKKLILNDTQ